MMVLRACLLVALAATAALAMDYLRPTGAFCATGSGCDKVRSSEYAAIFGWLPVPIVGLLAFPAVLGVSLLRPGRLRWRILFVLLVCGAVMALRFIALQALAIDAFCWLCIMANAATLVAAATLFGLRDSAHQCGEQVAEPLRPWAWAGFGAIAVIAPLLWPTLRPAVPVPEGVRQFYVEGRLNIVEFADFECPYCKQLHARMRNLLAKHPGPVNFVRLNVPLDSHAHARDAARAAVCASHQARGEEMAEALFESENLASTSIGRLVEIVGLDRELFDQCVRDPATDVRIDSEHAILEKIGFEGLPTVFIGQRKLLGLQSESILGEAIASALTEESEGGIPGAMYLAIVAAATGLVAFLGHRRTTRA